MDYAARSGKDTTRWSEGTRAYNEPDDVVVQEDISISSDLDFDLNVCADPFELDAQTFTDAGIKSLQIECIEADVEIADSFHAIGESIDAESELSERFETIVASHQGPSVPFQFETVRFSEGARRSVKLTETSTAMAILQAKHMWTDESVRDWLAVVRAPWFCRRLALSKKQTTKARGFSPPCRIHEESETERL